MLKKKKKKKSLSFNNSLIENREGDRRENDRFIFA